MLRFFLSNNRNDIVFLFFFLFLFLSQKIIRTVKELDNDIFFMEHFYISLPTYAYTKNRCLIKNISLSSFFFIITIFVIIILSKKI